MLIGLIAAVFSIPVSLFLPFDFWLFSWPQTVDMVLDTGWMTFLASLAVFLVIGIPIFLLLFAGLKLAFSFDSKKSHLGPVMFILWLAGLLLLAFIFLPGFIY